MPQGGVSRKPFCFQSLKRHRPLAGIMCRHLLCVHEQFTRSRYVTAKWTSLHEPVAQTITPLVGMLKMREWKIRHDQNFMHWKMQE